MKIIFIIHIISMVYIIFYTICQKFPFKSFKQKKFKQS